MWIATGNIYIPIFEPNARVTFIIRPTRWKNGTVDKKYLKKLRFAVTDGARNDERRLGPLTITGVFFNFIFATSTMHPTGFRRTKKNQN